METGLRPGYLGTAKRKGRQQTNQTYCYRATSLLYLGCVKTLWKFRLLKCAVGATAAFLGDWQKRRTKKALSGLDCLHQGPNAHDFHHSLQVVGEHMQAHLRTDAIYRLGQVFRKQHSLGSIFRLHESLHRNTPVRDMQISYHRRGFYTGWTLCCRWRKSEADFRGKL